MCRLLKTDEVGRVLGLSAWTVRKMCRSQVLRAIHVAGEGKGNRLRIEWNEVVRFMRERQQRCSPITCSLGSEPELLGYTGQEQPKFQEQFVG